MLCFQAVRGGFCDRSVSHGLMTVSPVDSVRVHSLGLLLGGVFAAKQVKMDASLRPSGWFGAWPVVMRAPPDSAHPICCALLSSMVSGGLAASGL